MTEIATREDLPAHCGIAFKEWAGICDALATGRQSIILRKGGIEEAPGGFVPEHAAFWLYPTRVHQAAQGMKPGTPPGPHATDAVDDGAIALRAIAKVDWIGRVEVVEVLDRLEDLHAWTEETVKSRFAYRTPGLWVLGVRVYLVDEPRRVPVTPEHAGCKTWVPLGEELSTTGRVPVIGDDMHAGRLGRIVAALARAT